MSYKDLKGQQFGYLTAIRTAGNDPHKHKMWLCKCVCSKETVVRGAALTAGCVRSCGCKTQEMKKGARGLRQSTHRKYTGQRYGQIVVTELIKEGGAIYAGFKCDCGGTGIGSLSEMKKGKLKSCGCIRQKQSQQAAIKRLMTILIRQKTPRKKRPPSPLTSRRVSCDIKHQYDNLTIGKATVIYHAGVYLNNKGLAADHLYYAQCGCGDYCIVKGSAIKSGNVLCKACLRKIRSRNAINTTKKRRRKKRNGIALTRQQIERRNKHTLQIFREEARLKYFGCCDICGTHDKEMDVHHLKSFSKYEKYRGMMANGILLCKKCHKQLHDEMGYHDTSIQDYVLFKGVEQVDMHIG